MAPLFQWLQDVRQGYCCILPRFQVQTGIGTIGREARHFVDFLGEAGIKIWQVCPLGPTGFGDSPYQCFSAFAGNPYFIDLETLIGQGLLEQRDLTELNRTSGRSVDYGAQWILRWPVLKKAFRTFISEASRSIRLSLRRLKKQKKSGWILTPASSL